ncbi:glyoxalase/bleomycin resistance/extradiol dioxygenase family protein [Jiangella aurantiaca]|uniref:Glyoxalase/bleomycin resistance/extradiol dioxygenase family protein n=1 Tax=Jiangella aurantiaca TaxID=2530373 RepID=A0A4R5A4I3_9ACTN|nr:VOC family protein [Jiangella aurantiaca]TDD65569.1 glyoxalase/bleomycin resistance/extradiol dioxygenase family protein [Jiangella aurantiaca]
MARKLFVNVRTTDLPRAIGFYTALGFTLQEDFSNEQAACVAVTDSIYVMALTEGFFAESVSNGVSTAGTQTILAVQVDSREEVDELADKALAAGGQKAKDPFDEGFMYGRSFLDPNGHHWELVWMNPEAS